MRRISIIIGGFILFLSLTCLGILSNHPTLSCVGAFASAALGSVISIIFESVDSHGQGMHLWWQHLKFWGKDVRLSISYLFRIEIDGKYLMVKGNRLKNQYQPVGGVYKYYTEAKTTLEGFGFRPDTKIGNTDETDDLRIQIKGEKILQFMEWFLTMKDREYDPTREFIEELIDTGLIPEGCFKPLRYRKVGIHNNGIQYSQYLSCYEFLYADIFEIIMTPEQKSAIKAAVLNNPDKLCLASAEELKTECYNGISKNLGTNATWVIGE